MKSSTNATTTTIEIQIEQLDRTPDSARANNPRTHSREQVAIIAASIRECDWTNPILVGADDNTPSYEGRDQSRLSGKVMIALEMALCQR